MFIANIDGIKTVSQCNLHTRQYQFSTYTLKISPKLFSPNDALGSGKQRQNQKISFSRHKSRIERNLVSNHTTLSDNLLRFPNETILLRGSQYVIDVRGMSSFDESLTLGLVLGRMTGPYKGLGAIWSITYIVFVRFHMFDVLQPLNA